MINLGEVGSDSTVSDLAQAEIFGNQSMNMEKDFFRCCDVILCLAANYLKMIRCKFGFICIAIFVFLSPSSAFAYINFCNTTSQKIDVAVGYVNGSGQWHSKGWFEYQPGECGIAFSEENQNRYYYYYAKASGLEWSGDGEKDAADFCIMSGSAFDVIDNPNCTKKIFSKIDLEGYEFIDITIQESPNEPLQAALNCRDDLSNKDAFIKCWINNSSTGKQKSILRCYENRKSPSSFAICANSDNFGSDIYKVANCADQFSNIRLGGVLIECLSPGARGARGADAFRCALYSRGDLSKAGGCAQPNTLNSDQNHIYSCVASNLNDFTKAGICAASRYLNADQQKILSCVFNNKGDYLRMGVCAAANHLTKEQQTFITCAVKTNAQPHAFAVCVGTKLTLDELDKCFTEGIGGHGCFGPNNSAVQFISNAWKDVTKGPGSGNEAVKIREQLLGGDRGTGANIVRDPIKCLTFQKKC
ncbi:DUF1036 domain-containing protein [Methylobacterium sp. Leaf87]|uniref:DUF1036 domain-containing protein n=1 Tax=Methylobacterium sp. Leaf87 TaxID=1736243 RepID=UPI0012E80323|nr:DUF1036 domain-containing protein [Methylobacterium sp. Leaf87]